MDEICEIHEDDGQDRESAEKKQELLIKLWKMLFEVMESLVFFLLRQGIE